MDYGAIAERIAQVPLRRGRRIVAIAGAPASGKSHLSERLGALIPNACVVPMDGFHRSNDDLQAHGLLARKGAPATFDVQGLIALVQRIGAAGEVAFPTFDRASDSVVPEGGVVRASDTTVVVEGNYLLFDALPWNALADQWDFTIRLDVPMPELRRRLLHRWRHFGYDAAAATQKAEQNDLPNARLVVEKALRADMVVSTQE